MVGASTLVSCTGQPLFSTVPGSYTHKSMPMHTRENSFCLPVSATQGSHTPSASVSGLRYSFSSSIFGGSGSVVKNLTAKPP